MAARTGKDFVKCLLCDITGETLLLSNPSDKTIKQIETGGTTKRCGYLGENNFWFISKIIIKEFNLLFYKPNINKNTNNKTNVNKNDTKIYFFIHF